MVAHGVHNRDLLGLENGQLHPANSGTNDTRAIMATAGFYLKHIHLAWSLWFGHYPTTHPLLA